jgi:hypothetical protein
MGIIGKLTVEAAPPDEEMYDFWVPKLKPGPKNVVLHCCIRAVQSNYNANAETTGGKGSNWYKN